MSKGSNRRKENTKQYEDNYKNIFWGTRDKVKKEADFPEWAMTYLKMLYKERLKKQAS